MDLLWGCRTQKLKTFEIGVWATCEVIQTNIIINTTSSVPGKPCENYGVHLGLSGIAEKIKMLSVD